MEYSGLYGDVNQVSLRFEKTEFSEVVVVHRMHVQLEELSINVDNTLLRFLEGSENVKRLYVLADVVELPSSFLTWITPPGIVSVVILCRILYFPFPDSSRLSGWGVNIPLLRLRVTETSQGVGQVFAVPAANDVAAALGLYIHADRIIYRHDPARNIPVIDLRVWGADSRLSSYRPDWPDAGVLLNNISCMREFSQGQPLTPADSDLQRSDEIELLAAPSGSDQHQLTISFAESHPGNFLLLNLLVDPPSSAFHFLSLPSQSVPAAILTDPNIILGMQMTMLIAELVLTAHSSPQLIKVVTRHVEWLNKMLVQLASPNDDILALLFRAQAYMKMAKQPHPVVPRLRYSMYSNLINRMVQIAQSYDQEFKQLKLFIAQNEILGSYLLEQNQAFAAKEKSMSVFHSQVVSLRKIELDNAIEKMNRLSYQMDVEREEMEQARKDMEQALDDYEKKQIANAVFAVLGAIASAALGFVTGGATVAGAVAAAATAVGTIARLAEMLNKVMGILEIVQQVVETAVAIKEVVESINNIGNLVDAPEMPEMPSNADWLIFVNEVEAAAEELPTEVGERTVWRAKCKNVAVLGQEMCTTGAHIAELQYQIKVEEMLQEIAERQAERLEGISSADLSSYMEMASQIDMRTTRLLLQLIRVLHIQSAALRYEYLYAANERLDSWPVSMETVWSMLLQQESSSLLGLLQLGVPNDDTRTYVVKDIPVEVLRSGRDWPFVIPVDDYTDFPSGWYRVRISHVELKFEQQAAEDENDIVIHQPSTATGKLYLLLQSSRFFSDRKQGEVMEYEASMGLSYAYAYNLNTGEPTLTNIPSSAYADTFMQMTPFTTWRLRLSASAEENQSLVFPTASPTSTTQISITFHLTRIRRIQTFAGDVE